MSELSPDQKGNASLTLGEVVVKTRNNFPDKRFHPKVYLDTPQYHLYGINPHPYQMWVTADGIGTKPELAERLTEATIPALGERPRDYSAFEGLAFDTFAMVESDEARWGRFMLGVANIIDTNTANPDMINALASGALKACNKGEFALLNGETAELGYRVSGYGDSRVNWNAVGVSLINPEKLILGQDLAPGQFIVGLPETSIRSNGLTKARQILETAYLTGSGYGSKTQYVLEELYGHFGSEYEETSSDPLNSLQFLEGLLGHNFLEQVQLPWHDDYYEITKELSRPSTLYSPFMYAAQNGVDGKRDIDIVAAAHISGGGVPEKAKRMVEYKGLGVHIDPVFPDPSAVTMLMELAQNDLPEEVSNKIIDDKKACEQWNRGLGFLIVVKSKRDVEQLFMLGQRLNIPAYQVGEVIEEPKIEWRDHTWSY